MLFAEKAKRSKKSGEESLKLKELPSSGLQGKSFSGNLPSHNCNLKVATPKLNEVDETWYYIKQGKSTAFSTRKAKAQTRVNSYKKLFKRGAEITPRNFFFIELSQEKPSDWEDRIINIKTSNSIKGDSKAPWKGNDLSGKIESRFLFRTALSKSILPFALFAPDLIVLPVTIEHNSDKDKREVKLHSAVELMREGYLNASKWFQSAENIWNIHRTEKNRKITAIDYLNWNNKLVSQNINSPFLVIYNASAKDANATIVERSHFDLEFFVDTKAYAFYTNSINEAYYLTAILNSTAPNLLMKDFQSKGLFGARDVHKKILDIYYPKFDKNDPIHKELSELSKQSHHKTNKYINDNPPRELSAIHLGKLRVAIKKNLSEELKKIDALVKKIL
ncbi:MAG: hypothetical protein IPJ60_12745 [Sphingobacteriaceae bacterium]|nr:hypothetical protein [Sphingobacteriaceae bacterium]